MHNKTQAYLIAALLAGLVLLAACSPAKSETPTPDANTLITQAAATVGAQLTQMAALTPSPAATATLAPTNPPLATDTPAAQPTSEASPTAAGTTPAPQAQATKTGDAGSFVADVTVPDGTGAAPGSAFDKVWRVKNTGVTTWDTTYSLMYVDGDRMGAPDNGAPLPKAVRPGEEVDITMHLTAPLKPGTYQTFFRLRNAGGQYFRLDGTGDLWIKIIVGGAAVTPNMTQTAAYTPGVTATPTLAPSSTATH